MTAVPAGGRRRGNNPGTIVFTGLHMGPPRRAGRPGKNRHQPALRSSAGAVSTARIADKEGVLLEESCQEPLDLGLLCKKVNGVVGS